jgi:SnoaL-like domain
VKVVLASIGIDRPAVMRACERLSTAFCYHADHGNFGEVGRLFSPTGKFDRFGEALSGPDEIAAAMSKRPEGIVTRHGLLSVYFTIVDATVAEAVVNSATFYGFQTPAGTAELAPASPRVVEFKDRYRLVEGEWRIEMRVGTVVLVNQG